MKLCFFSLNRLAFVGGAEKYILEVSRVFKEKGHTVFYLGDCRPLLVPNVLAGFLAGMKGWCGAWREFWALWRAPSFPEKATMFIQPQQLALAAFLPFGRRRWETTEFLKSCDLVFVKNEILDMLAFWWLSLFSGKIKAVLLAFSSFYYPSATRRGQLHNLFYLSPFYKWLVKKFARIVVSNRADAKFLENEFGALRGKVKLIPYGLDPADFSAERVVPRGEGVFKILFVGRLEEQKGVDILVEVARRLGTRVQGKELYWTVVGDGPWREKIESLAKELPQIEYLGELPRARVIQEYGRYDLLLVPSRWETFSYVTLEAQFCGLPVVAFDIPGPQGIIEEGVTGRLVKLGDTDGLVGAVTDYVQGGVGEEERARIRLRAQERFSAEKTATALISIF